MARFTFTILGYEGKGRKYIRGASGANYIPFSAERVHLIRSRRDRRVPPIDGVEVKDDPRFPTILYIFPGKLYHQLRVEESYNYAVLWVEKNKERR